MRDIMKSQNGVTLVQLTIYLIAMLVVIGMMTTLSNFFYGNINIIREASRYAAEFDKFNTHFVKDVESNNEVNITTTDGQVTIIFEDGTTYTYNSYDEGLYRGSVKISTNVKAFTATKKIITINNVDKDIVTVKIIIGNSTQTLFSKQIDYTLKYW